MRLTLVRAPNHIIASIAVITNHCFQLDPFFSWLRWYNGLERIKQLINHNNTYRLITEQDDPHLIKIGGLQTRDKVLVTIRSRWLVLMQLSYEIFITCKYSIFYCFKFFCSAKKSIGARTYVGRHIIVHVCDFEKGDSKSGI